MNLMLMLLLVIAGLWILVRLFEARSRLALGLVLALLLIVVARWSGRPAPLPLGNSASLASAAVTDAVAAPEANLERAAAAGQDEAAGGSPEAAPSLDADQAGGDPAGLADAAAESDELTIELVAEEGRPIRPPIPPEKSWVDAPPELEGDVHTIAVSSGPCNSPRECKDALAEQLEAAVDKYVDWYLGKVYGDRFKASHFVDFDAEYVRTKLVNAVAHPEREYDEVIQHSFGPMHQRHALVTFGPDFRHLLDSRRAVIDQRWRQMQQTGRVLAVALGFGLILAVLGVIFGYFRLDTATRGYYSGRLQFASVVAILAVVVAGLLLARQVPWM